MENVNYEKSIATKSYLIPRDPVKIFLSLFIFFVLLLPNYIWAGIKCLMQTRKDVRGKVILVSIIHYYYYNYSKSKWVFLHCTIIDSCLEKSL